MILAKKSHIFRYGSAFLHGEGTYLKIAYVRAITDVGEFQIGQFCIPPQFEASNPGQGTIEVSSSNCTLGSNRSLAHSVALNWESVYSAVIDFEDMDHVSRTATDRVTGISTASPPEPSSFELSLITNDNTLSDSSVLVEYALYWGDAIYSCSAASTGSSVDCDTSNASTLECAGSDFGLFISNPSASGSIIIDEIKVNNDLVRTYIIESFCMDSSVGANAGNETGNCTNTEHSRWNQLCVGNDSSICSESSVYISFPSDLFANFDSLRMDGVVDNSKSQLICLTFSPTFNPTNEPTVELTPGPTDDPTSGPTDSPTMEPTTLESLIVNGLLECDVNDECYSCTSILVTLASIKLEENREECCDYLWTYSTDDLSECNDDDCCIDVGSYLRGTSMQSESLNFDEFDSTFMLIGALLLILLLPASCSLYAYCAVHSRRPGSDRPHYLSIFKVSINVADFYSDIIWTLTLIFQCSEYAIWAALFTFGSYAVSMGIAISFVTKWKVNRLNLSLSGYAEKYSAFMLACTALAGFYATAELITSHILHLSVFSLNMTVIQRQHIRTLRILNTVILENLPLLILQLLYLSSDSASEESLDLTVITIMFSSLSILSGVSNMITIMCSRLIAHQRDDSSFKKLLMEFSLKQKEPGSIKSYHIHSYYLLQIAVASALHLEQHQVVILKIQKVTDGLTISLKLKYLAETKALKLISALKDSGSAMLEHLALECTHNLKFTGTENVKLEDLTVTFCADRGSVALSRLDNKITSNSNPTEIVYSDEEGVSPTTPTSV